MEPDPNLGPAMARLNTRTRRRQLAADVFAIALFLTVAALFVFAALQGD